MRKTALHIHLDPDLHADFLAAAEASDSSAEDILVEFVREYAARVKEDDGYETFLRQKVEKARSSIKAGRLFTNSDVEQEFLAKRAGKT